MGHQHHISIMVLWLLAVTFLQTTVATKCPAGCVCDPARNHVKCNGNRQPLTNIPTDIPTHAEYLILENNNLTVLRYGAFAQLGQLKFLYLRNNSINFIEEDAFLGVTKLEWMDISQNNLEYLNNSYTTTFRGAENLRQLSLEQTSLSVIPDAVLARLRKLSVLNLERNNINNSTLGDGFRNLTHLRQLNLRRNNLGELTNRSFVNIRHSKLERLNLLRSNITVIEIGTFAGLPHLTELNLTENSLQMGKPDIDAMLKPLCKAQVTKLGFSRTGLTNITGMFNCFKNLTYLDISGNELQTLEDNVFNFEHQLKLLNIKMTPKLTTMGKKALQGLNRLRILNLSKCKLSRLPVFADKKGQSFLPNITYLDLAFNNIDRTDKLNGHSPFRGLEGIISLSLAHNRIRKLTADLLSPLESIKYLDVANNNIKEIERRSFSELQMLKSLNVESNPWKVGQYCYFANLTWLEHLNLEGVNLRDVNTFVYVDDFTPDCLFEGLDNLKVLDLTNTNLKGIPTRFFKDLRSLQELILRQNRLSGWNDVVFDNLTALQFLDVAVNQIRVVNMSSLQSVLKSLNRFQAFSNPYICDCNLAWYADWLRRMHAANNFTLKVTYQLPYNCSNLKRVSVLSYRPTFFECHRLLIILSASGGGLFILVMLTVTVLYQYRWYIRYWMFLLRSRRAKHVEEADRLIYKYDGFVTYSGEDSEWVIRTLLPKLEKEYGFSMCIHERDFTLGRDISENIAESIEQSRKVLVVLTNNFVRSYWCKFEVNLAHANTLHNSQKARQSLIIILAEDVDMDLMTPILRYLIRRKTYIEWTMNDQGQILFWKRLKEAMQKRGNIAGLEED